MGGFEERVREDKEYLCRVIERSEMFKLGSKKLYHYNYKKTNYIFFFGRSLPSNHIEVLGSKFGTYSMLIFSSNLCLNSN